MATPEKILNRTEEIVAGCKEARHISLGDRDDFIEIMKRACAGTNGLTADDKLQACAENLANLTYLFIRDKLEGAAAAGFWPALFRLIERCKNQIVIISLGAFALLAYRPQIIQIVNHFTGQ